MSLSKHKYKPSYDFPEEILSEVLKRHPVKYVLRCGAVKKSWYSLIKSPIFISLHSNYQKLTAHTNPKYLLFDDRSIDEFTICSDDKHCQKYCTSDYPFDLPACSWYTHSNGLICLSTLYDCVSYYNPDIYIWNPLGQKFKTVPKSPLSTCTIGKTNWHALAFGFLPEINDYIVILVVKPNSTSTTKDPHSVVIVVYSLNTNSWKKIYKDKAPVGYICTEKSVFVNGTAFWVGHSSEVRSQVIMFFDTKTNILGHVEVPEWAERHSRQFKRPLILPFGKSIAYFVECNESDWNGWDDDDDDDYGSPHLDIWILKGDMINELSLEKKMSVKLAENVWAEVLGTRNNGDPILAKSDSMISYNLNTHEPYDFVESYYYLTPTDHGNCSKLPFVICPFVETLVLLDID